MNKDLFNLVLMGKDGDKKAILTIIEKFDPIINKYTRILDYDEDVKEELILSLIETIKKIPIEKGKEEKYIVSYIATSLKNKYIYMSKRKRNIASKECGEIQFNLIKDENFNIDDRLILNNMLESLTPMERKVIENKYVDGLRDIDIANLNYISRQAVNQNKNRALNKLRKKYLN